MTFSLVIPTCNRAELLERALRSVYAQSRLPNEVIVVDDGSVDETVQMLETKFPMVQCISQMNTGVSAARNRGIEAAVGEWIVFLDSDDEWLPNKLDMQMNVCSARSGPKICHCDEIWIRRGRRVNQMKKHQKHGGWIFHKCVELCAISPSAVAIHRSVFETVGLFDEQLPACEDYDLWLRITSRYPVNYIDQPLIVKYAGHDDQLSTRYWGMDRFRIIALKKILDGNFLTPSDRRVAVATLVRKAEIMANGARKRGKFRESAEYESLGRRYLEVW